MTKFFLITVGVLVLIVAVLILVVWIQHETYKTKIAETENRIINEQNEKTQKSKEILNNANKKKSDIRTGADIDNFNASLNILQNYAKSRNAKNTD